ncbi:MAG: hypothetical protein ACWA5A_06630 [Marinibacterium sp.]
MPGIPPPSPELVAFLRHWNGVVQTRDGAALVNMMTASEHLIYQGSAAREIWTGLVFFFAGISRPCA